MHDFADGWCCLRRAIERHDEKTVVQLNRLDASDVPAAPSLSEQAAAAARHKQLKHVQTVEQPHLHESFAQKDLELRIEKKQAKEAAKPSPQASPPDDPASEPRRTGSPTEEIEKQLVFSSPGADPEPGGGSSRGAG